MTDNYVFFNSRDELLRVNLPDVVYFEANGNYTHVITINKLKASVGMSLVKMESVLRAQTKKLMFIRVGKRFIVNINFIYQLNIPKQRLVLTDYHNFAYSLPISRDALRQIKDFTLKNKI